MFSVPSYPGENRGERLGEFVSRFSVKLIRDAVQMQGFVTLDSVSTEDIFPQCKFQLTINENWKDIFPQCKFQLTINENWLI